MTENIFFFVNALHRGLGIPGLDDGIRETWPNKASVQREPEAAAPLGVP